MLGMSKEQWYTTLGQMLPFVSGIAVAFGWLTTAQAGELTTSLLAAFGPVVAIGSLTWRIYMNRKAAILNSAAAMPEVKNITLDPAAPETKALNDVTPANVKVGANQGEVK